MNDGLGWLCMAFQDEHSPSITVKVLLSASILGGIFVSVALSSGYSELLIDLFRYEKEPGNTYRQMIMASCSLLYFIRFTICMFIFFKTKNQLVRGQPGFSLIFHDVLFFWNFRRESASTNWFDRYGWCFPFHRGVLYKYVGGLPAFFLEKKHRK